MTLAINLQRQDETRRAASHHSGPVIHVWGLSYKPGASSVNGTYLRYRGNASIMDKLSSPGTFSRLLPDSIKHGGIGMNHHPPPCIHAHVSARY